MKKILLALFLMSVVGGSCEPVYAEKEYAQRFPTGTRLEVYTPNNQPPTPDLTAYLTTSAASSTYVPYTGASANLDLGANNISADYFLGHTQTDKSLWIDTITGDIGRNADIGGGIWAIVPTFNVFDNTANISKLTNLTSNGLVTTSGSNGTLGITDPSSFLTTSTGLTLAAPNQTVTQVPTFSSGISISGQLGASAASFYDVNTAMGPNGDGSGIAKINLRSKDPSAGWYDSGQLEIRRTDAGVKSFAFTQYVGIGYPRAETFYFGQDAYRLSLLTTNGFLKTGSSDGTLSVDTNTYLTSSDAVTFTGGIALPALDSGKFLSNNGSVLSWETVAAPDLSGYEKLDGTNQPSTGNKNLSKDDPEFRLTDTGNSEYARLLKTDTTNFAYQYNRTGKVAEATKSLTLASNDYIDLATQRNAFNALANGTINFWLKTSTTDARLFYLGYPAYVASDGFKLDIASGKLRWIYHNGNAAVVSFTSTNNVNDNAWHMVTIRGGTGGNSVWIDGLEMAGSYATGSASTEVWFATSSSNPTQMTIGAGYVYNSSLGGYYNGEFDDWGFWSAKITDEAVGLLYKSGDGLYFATDHAILGTGLFALYRFDDDVTTIVDAMGSYSGVRTNFDGDEYNGIPKITRETEVGEYLVWSSRDGVSTGESNINTFGDDEGRTVLDGRTVRFNIAGAEKGQLSSTGMAWTLPNTITGSSDAVQLKVVGNATQTSNIVYFQNSADTASLGLTNTGYITSKNATATDNLVIQSATYPLTVLTGGQNAFVGSGAGTSATGATDNVCLGYASGYNLTTGDYNIALGSRARVGTTGSHNISIGYRTGEALVSGNYNLLIGNAVGIKLTGGNNTAIGYNAFANGVASNSNTILGYLSGTALTTGSSNIFLGNVAGQYQTTGSNVFLVDNQNRTNAANELTQSLLYGVMAASPADQTLRINGRTGINIAPSAMLTLPAGTATAGTAPLKFTSGTNLSTTEAGAIEFAADDYFATITSGAGGNLSFYPPAHSGTYVKATDQLSGYESYVATNPAVSLVDVGTNSNWLTNSAVVSNQRFHIDVGSAKTIDRVYYENWNNANQSTLNRGVKDFTLWGSNSATAFAELTYATDTDWTQLTTDVSQLAQHNTNYTVADPRYVAVTGAGSYRYYAFKFANNWGATDRMGLKRVELQNTAQPSARKNIVLTDNGVLTSGRIPIATTNGRLTDGPTPVTDGTYTVGAALTPGVGVNGTITVANGLITAIQEAT